MKIIRVAVEPYRTPAPGEPKNARQALFLICVGDETCDLFYNGRDGLRARYWQSPDHGFGATRYLIGNLMSSLISFAENNVPIPVGKAAPMASEEIKASLDAPSAKIWPRERDDNGNSLLADHQLLVLRWEENEPHASINKGMWRRTPRGGELEIKGGILGPDGTEYIPTGKRDRSCQIHHFGFT
ncbi:hypothetical protein [Bradyrhizobium sp. AZCC 2289]|uniref:hypothetical protein n=1 Tax=Bradyrhizobium sp. AZCC 2289 TaxID=3117026 RepID=UPI002FF03D5A